MAARDDRGMADVLLEIRTYRLHAGATGEFDRLFRDEAGPLLREFGIDVVRAGASEQREDGEEAYVLLRAFASVAAREEQEQRFYSSPQWHSGPREGVLAAIESYHTVVLSVPAEAVAALRA